MIIKSLLHRDIYPQLFPNFGMAERVLPTVDLPEFLLLQE